MSRVMRAVVRAEVLIGIGFVAGAALSGFVRGIYMGWFGISGCI